MESLAGMKWNRWPEWNGIHGRDHLEYAFYILKHKIFRCKMALFGSIKETMSYMIVPSFLLHDIIRGAKLSGSSTT